MMLPAEITVTFFTDYTARAKREERLAPDDLVRLIREMIAPKKSRLPWLKLGRFGDLRSDKNSLRHDENLRAISGIETDYDGELVSFEAAVEIAEKAGLAAIIYTSPSHTPARPRWRVLCPTSKELPPADRGRLVARLNGLYRGIFATESWTLSQSYYYGAVASNSERAHRVEIIVGATIDLLDELDQIAIGKPNGSAGEHHGTTQSERPLDDDALAAAIVSGHAYHLSCTRLVGKWAQTGVPFLDAQHRLEALFDRVFPPDRDQRWHQRRADIPRIVRDIYGKDARQNDEAARPRSISRSTLIKKGEIGMLQKVEWAWPGWLARGKLHILGGMKGVGKSTIAFDLLAQITVGGKWPDGTQAPLGDVLIWSGEDDINDTILPRIYAAGGDVTRVHWPAVTIVDGVKRSFDPATDIPSLLEAVRSLPTLSALLIDPVVSASAADSHKNSETRRGLQPLVGMAIELNLILIGITHFTKGTQGQEPIERITGSLAFGAIPRVVMGAVKGADEDGPRKLVRIASNIGRSGGGFEYLLRQDLLPGFDFTAQRVVWGKQLTGSALELLGDGQAKSQKLGAIKFLDDMLAGGARVKVKEIQDAAKAHGFSWPTVERAKKEIGTIVAEQADRVWHWRKNVDGLTEP